MIFEKYLQHTIFYRLFKKKLTRHIIMVIDIV
jgi:hypothetical protein